VDLKNVISDLWGVQHAKYLKDVHLLTKLKERTMWYKTKLLTAFASTLLGIGLLSGCNTIEGAGQDMKAAGDKIEDATSENKNY
tara:strand:- start:843 stop:1094 length:252 start_codon:yes stop_codon:yes gene_type:complete